MSTAAAVLEPAQERSTHATYRLANGRLRWLPRVTIGRDCNGPTPEPTWFEAVRQLAPRTEHGHDWLLLRWEPGDWWDPIERWLLYTMTPEERLPREFRMWLNGRNPRDFGYYDRVKQRFISTYKGNINYQQWQLFRQYRCLARPWWIIQGYAGGHRREYTTGEKLAVELRGGDPDPPLAGTLPYAPPDNRTWEWVRSFDLVHKYGDILSKLLTKEGFAAALSRREKEVAVEVALQLSNWLDESVSASLDLTYRQASAIRSLAGEAKPALSGDDVNESFIETVAGVL